MVNDPYLFQSANLRLNERNAHLVSIYFSLAFNLISVPAKATDTGQVFFVCSANSLNFAWSIPGTSASVSRSMDVILNPAPTCPRLTLAVVAMCFGA